MEQNLTFMLIETADEMQRTLEHIDKICAEQNELIAVVESSEKAKKFKEFCNSLRSEITNTLIQKTQLETRHKLLVDVIDVCQANEDTAIVVSNLCKAFGIFQDIPEKQTQKQSEKIVPFTQKK